MEFESFIGTLLYIGIQEGEGAPVDSLLAIVGPEVTDVEAAIAASKRRGYSCYPCSRST